MKNIILIISLFVTSFLSAQELLPPPPPAEPTKDNKVLIDELIRVTDFENYVYNYCKNRVEQAAKENNWDEKKKQEIITSIYFDQFKNTIYNTFALFSKDELQDLTKLFKKLDTNKRNLKLVPMSDAIQQNLEGFAKNIAQGEYIFLNNKATH